MLNQVYHKLRANTLLYTVAISILTFSCTSGSKVTEQPKQGYISTKAMVVSAHPDASQIGAEILRKGGNAYDAAIAVHFALAVAHPAAGNIGGGGFLVYRQHTGETGALDFREMAPSAAT